MPTIIVLPENLINQIAAGEVVERPYSCVKELVENSIDADAGAIAVEIEEGGKTYIKVADDGIGMDKKDAKLCFERHATSKITTQEDLMSIGTMGFRGEAISSIGSVSLVKLQTKKRGELVGTLVVCEGGRITKHEDCGTREGTQIEIKKLFFNTPARQKYLKADATEFQHVVGYMSGIALSHPEISFKLMHNGKMILDLPGGQTQIDRIRYVLGREITDNMIPIFYGGASLRVDGYIGKPGIARSTRDHQHLFVNHRTIGNAAVSFAIKDSFKSLLPHGKYPLFVINIDIDPTQVDVNVHPRKEEVRFVNQREVFQKVQAAVTSSLDKYMLSPKIEVGGWSNTEERIPAVPTQPGAFAMPKASPSDVANAMKFTEEISGIGDIEREHQSLATAEQEQGLSMTPLVQVANSYIVAQNDEGLVLIDQHAAHERIMYERLLKEFENKSSLASQPLLLPLTLELSLRDSGVLNENLEFFEKLGFEIEAFSGQTYSVNAVPGCLAASEDPGEAISGILDDITNSRAPSNLQDRTDKMLHYIACRSAIKFGQRLSHDEQLGLLRDLEKTSRCFSCPHGRPTMIQLTFEELDKRFGRK